MSTLIILLLCGAAGGFIFEWFGLPGGAMTGAIIAVILLKSFSSLPQAAFPLILSDNIFCSVLAVNCNSG